ncbi:MAG: hypothetical protein D3926_07895 [Desulfobacteraceae bacterium]|nr:MAG: hypothetical protein D3926_07895 [Desulfobacteraceae bacterium]
MSFFIAGSEYAFEGMHRHTTNRSIMLKNDENGILMEIIGSYSLWNTFKLYFNKQLEGSSVYSSYIKSLYNAKN